MIPPSDCILQYHAYQLFLFPFNNQATNCFLVLRVRLAC